MKKYIYIIIWLLSPVFLSAQTNIMQAQYWFDGQYSTEVTQNMGPTANLTLNEMIDVSGLINGLHTVTYRFKDTRGIWGPVLTKFFTCYQGTSTPGIREITELEYWYDADYTHATKVSIGPGTTLQISELLDVAALVNGLHTICYRFKDDRNIWGPPQTKFFTKSQSTGLHEIVKLEYWYDNDYENVIQDAVVPTTSFDINENLDISGLSIGIHTVNCRFQDDAGKWSPVRSWMFHNVPSQNGTELHEVVAMEYWFNGDRLDVQKSPVSSNGTFNLSASLDISSLNHGLHYVSYRFLDDAGNWSSAVSKFFSHYPETESPEMHQITALEYWFDGEYNTASKNTISATNTLSIDENIDVSGLDHGLHFVSYRFQDEAGRWSSVESKMFSHYPDPEASAMREITAYEYWFDGDITNSTSKNVGETDLLAIDETLDIKALGEGLHFVSYRFKDKSGGWSSTKSQFFSYYENEPLPAENKIVAYRYWADENIAGATEVSLTTPLKSVILDELIDVANFPGGEHLASFQFVDEQGNWSGAISQTISKTVEPFVEISADDSTVCLGTPILFSSDVVDANAIEWKFGDGNTSLDFNPEHIYTEAGFYEITAIVTHTDSAKSAYDTIVGGITVSPSHQIWLGGADTTFVSTFEDDALNARPSGWIQKYNGTGDVNQKVVDNPVKVGTKAFQMEGASGWASEFYRRPVNMPNEVTVEAWVNCEKILSGLAGSIGVGNFTVGTWGTRTSRLQFHGGKISATYSGGPIHEIMDYTPGQWYLVKMVHNLTNRTYQVYINNVLASGTNGGETTSVFPMHPSVETIDVMLAAGNSGTNKMIFDDILLVQKGDFEVCENDLPYQLGSQQISTEGYFSETFTNNFGCDSVVSLNLKINPTYEVELDSVVICQGESYLFGTETLTTSGTYRDTVQTINGCDSIVVLDLTVNPTYEIPLAASICQGNTYEFGGEQLTETNTYYDSLQTINGCDSVLVLSLTVNPSYETPIEASICQGDNYSFGGELLSTAGTYKDTIPSINSCDSVIVLTLNVNPVYETAIDSTICDGDSVNFGGDILTTTGIYKDSLTSVSGCDSVIIFTLTVNPVYTKTATASICSGNSYLFGGIERTISGNYTHTFESINGCDSTVTLTLNVSQTIEETINQTICDGNTYAFGGNNLATTGEYKDTLSTANGCDSVVTLNLTVNPVFETVLEASICEGDDYTFAGKTQTTEGTYKDTLQSIHNCDSVIVLNLSVNPVYEVLLDTSICEGESYLFGTKSFTTTGIYKDTVQTVNSCDSIIVLNLTVHPTYNINTSDTICDGDSYILGDTILTSNGIYSFTFQTAYGCDSTVNLSLTVNPVYDDVVEASICKGDSYIFDKDTLYIEGDYEYRYQTANGCDSVITLALTVNPTFDLDIKVNIEEDEFPYLFGSTLIDTAGLYRDTFPTVFGCDSVVTLYLNIADEVPPVAKCNPIEIALERSGTYTLTKSDLDQLSTGSTDDVSEYKNLKIKATPSRFSCSDVGNVKVTLSVTDEAGNQDICETTVVVSNNHPILLTKVNNIEVTLPSGVCETKIDYPYIGAFGPCVSLKQTTGLGKNGVFPIGTTTETWVGTNTSGSSETLSFNVTVIAENKAPTFDSIADVDSNEDTAVSIKLSGITNGGDCVENNVSLSVSSYDAKLISTATINYTDGSDTASLEIVPIANMFGSSIVTIEAEDSEGAKTSRSFTLLIKPVNDAPVLVGTLPNQEVDANEMLDISLSKLLGVLFDDIDNDSLGYTVRFENGLLPAWISATETADMFTLNFAPLLADTGCYNIEISAFDAAGLMVADTFEFCVNKVLVGIDDLENGVFEVNLYPNPSKGPVSIDINTSYIGELEVIVMNVAGSQIFRKEYHTNEPVRFDLSNHVSGTYVAIIKINNKRVVKKFILDRK